MADDNLHDWKALLILSFLQCVLIYSVGILVEELVGKFLLSNDVLFGAGPLSITVGLLNYLFLLHNDRWRRFEGSFRSYSRTRRRVSAFLIALGMIATIVLFIASVLSIDPVVQVP